jgi:hypothetical protein
MDCEQANNFLSARLDGELAAQDAASLDAHLAGCPDCRITAQEFSDQQMMMMRAFSARRDAASAIADAAIMQLNNRRRSPWRWARIPLAAAAGFLLAVLLFHPWAKPPPTRVIVQMQPEPDHSTAPSPSAALLTIATGQVQFRGSDGQWHAMETGGGVPAGATVRTPQGVRCEFRCPDASEVRLDQSTQIQFTAPRKLGVAEGQVWSAVSKTPHAFSIDVPGATVTADVARCNINCRSGQTTLTVLDGTTQVRAGNAQTRVSPGEQLTVSDGHLSAPSPVGEMDSASRWLDEILVLKGRDNKELVGRINDLMAQIGQTKVSYLCESEIRALGDHCVVPLTRYIQSDRSSGDAERRIKAAQIVADSAQPWCIPYLIELLEDHDGAVRAAAAGAMQRLTGTDMGRSTEQWKTATPLDCRRTAGDWRAWWRQNKDQIPGAGQTPATVEQKV